MMQQVPRRWPLDASRGAEQYMRSPLRVHGWSANRASSRRSPQAYKSRTHDSSLMTAAVGPRISQRAKRAAHRHLLGAAGRNAASVASARRTRVGAS